jgi:hypothetical protein
MSKPILSPFDVVGLLHPSIDAHTLGVASVFSLLESCGHRSILADEASSSSVMKLSSPGARVLLREWLTGNRVSCLGFSYRLDPEDGLRFLKHLIHFLHAEHLWAPQGGPLRRLFFAGLPSACARVRAECPEVDAVFQGDESVSDTLRLLGVSEERIPASLREGLAYDEARLAFGRKLVGQEQHLSVGCPRRGQYPGFGTEQDRLVLRLANRRALGLPPLLRAHVGPYAQDRDEAIRLFDTWVRQLASDGYLDVLSIGTSQLSQQDFFGSWDGKPDGGGVPLHSPGEFASVWKAARPMLVRSYAGTAQVPRMAAMLEESIHIAWHALSLWWFCQIDGRGDNSLLENLRQHCATLDYIAKTGKPFEANVPHHFSFRGSDDVSYVLSAFLSAKLARHKGIRHFVLQLMLNTPKATWGVQDLAKGRAALRMLRRLEGPHFRVVVQTRGGLDYFSPAPEKAKAQLAAVTALMADLEPENVQGPDIIHVVSYSEAYALADPIVIKESCQITLAALEQGRIARAKGDLPSMADSQDVEARVERLMEEADALMADIEARIPHPLEPEGLYAIFAQGYLPAPFLWRCRDEFPHAIAWRSGFVNGGIRLTDSAGALLSTADRISRIHLLNQDQSYV